MITLQPLLLLLALACSLIVAQQQAPSAIMAARYANDTNNPLGFIVIYEPNWDDRAGNYGACVRLGSVQPNISVT